MKKCFGWMLVTAGIIFGLASNGFAASGNVKIAYFDINSAILNSQWGKKVNDDLKREQERLRSELDQKAKAIKSASDEFDKKKDVMDEKARTKRQRELQEMLAEGEKMAQEHSAKWNQQANQARGPIMQKVSEIVNKIGKDEKYDFIFEKGTLHYGTDKDDLTKRITSELDKAGPR